jgi:ATP/maltotriose-dependent transcriptional regulator MalT
MGDLEGAVEAMDEGLELGARLGDERLTVFLGAWKALATADAGRLEEGAEIAERWIERADTLALKTGQVESRRVRAHIAQLAGDHEAVLEFCRQCDQLLEGTDEAIHPVWMAPTICGSLIAVGDLGAAERGLEETLEATRRSGMVHWEGMALKVRSRLCAALGDHDAARADLDAAIAIFDELGSRIDLGRSLVLRGADEDLERARELFESCGALGDLERLGSSGEIL